jgi:hypothetical protein
MLENFSFYDKTVLYLSSKIEEQGDFGDLDPPKVYAKDGKTYVIDGNHTVKASRGCKLSWIPLNHISDSQLRDFGYDPDTIHLETSY